MHKFPWPHNLSQFKRILQDLVTMSTRTTITAEDVKKIFALENSSPIAISSLSAPVRFDLNRTLDEMEKEIIFKVLDECNGNQTYAAKRLGISRSTLWRLVN